MNSMEMDTVHVSAASWNNSEVSGYGLTKGLSLMSGLEGPKGKTHTLGGGGGERGVG